MLEEQQIRAHGQGQQVIVVHAAERAGNALQPHQADDDRNHDPEVAVTGQSELTAREAVPHPRRPTEGDALQCQRQPVATDESDRAPYHRIREKQDCPGAQQALGPAPPVVAEPDVGVNGIGCTALLAHRPPELVEQPPEAGLRAWRPDSTGNPRSVDRHAVATRRARQPSLGTRAASDEVARPLDAPSRLRVP